MTKLIIADTHLHYDLQNELLEKNGNTAIADFDMLSPSAYFRKQAKHTYLSEMEALQMIKHALNKEESPVFRELLHSEGFHRELYRILEELKQNGCEVDELPEDTSIHSELKRILKLIEYIHISANMYHDAYLNIIQCDNYQDVTFINYYPVNYYESYILSHMIAHGAKQEIRKREPSDITYNYVLNIRHEVEHVAKSICQLSNTTMLEDIQVLIPDASYVPYISFVFERYNIPYYNTLETQGCIAENTIRSLLTFMKSHNMEDLLTFIFSPLIAVSYKNELSSYINAFEITYEELHQPFNKLSLIDFSKEIFNNYNQNKSYLEYLEEKALLAQAELLPILNALNQSTLYSFVMSVYNLLRISERLSDTDKRYLAAFKSHLMPLKHALISFSFEEGLPYLEKELNSISIASTRYENVIRVTTYQRSYLNCNHSFVLGAHQKNYPNFTGLSGLFDEALVTHLTNYPSLDKRYSTHLEKLKNSLSVSKNLYITYPESGFDGKPRGSSLELALAFNLNKPTYKELIENDVYEYPSHSINTELGTKLLIPNNHIRGSVTSIERFFKCPYQYFLKSGLHINDLNNLTINETAFGSLQHKILEDVISLKGKEYVNICEEEIDNFLEEEFSAFTNLYPNKKTAADIMKEITKQNIMKSLETLKNIEEHTRFIPKAVEYSFDKDYLKHNDVTLELRGKIDRLDTNYNGYRIIDYKSSDHAFSLSKFHNGTLLQLLTYATIIEQELSDKTPYGMYYFSLANKITDDVQYKINRKGKEPKIEEIETHAENNQLIGYTFTKEETELQDLDDDASHIKSIKINSKGEFSNSTKNYMTYDELKEDLHSIYQYFIERLQQADISCSPIAGACKYCNYDRICGFKGREAKEKPLPIFKEAKEEDDNA